MDPGAERFGALGVIENACVRIDENLISWLGSAKNLPEATDDYIIDCNGGVVLPGLVECHTHLVFAGSRENEFRMRSEGKTYQEIAKAGGGILSTVKATRAASAIRKRISRFLLTAGEMSFTETAAAMPMKQ